MGSALDAFELEGIGHNLPFLSAVMAHPRFRAGDLATSFITEEWPEGFAGVDLADEDLRRVAAASAAMWRVAEIRRARVSGRIDHHERRVGSDWVVQVGDHAFPVTLAADLSGADVAFTDGSTLRVEGPWSPGRTLARLRVGGRPLLLKVEAATGGFRLRTGGADLRAFVRAPREAELAALMPPKRVPDTSRVLLCPMPGLLTQLLVGPGDEVEDGQPLATVEAMKMENTLRAPRKGRVKALGAKVGDTLAVDQPILEFEQA
jgi:propionyl-CoA carboxylase alpha chain